MALTLEIQGTPSSLSIVSGQSVTLIAAVTNAGSSSVTLQSLSAASESSISSTISQPDYLTPNMPVTLGNPTLLPSTTYYFPFRVVYLAPNMAGPSPNAPSGVSGVSTAAYPTDSDFRVSIQSLSSDGTVASASTTDPVLSAIAPFPVPLGGTLQFNSGFNLVNLLTSFA